MEFEGLAFENLVFKYVEVDGLGFESLGFCGFECLEFCGFEGLGVDGLRCEDLGFDS